MRSRQIKQSGVGAAVKLAAWQLQGSLGSYRKEVTPMRIKYAIALVALAMVGIVAMAGDALAQSTGRGYLAGTGDYDWWTANVSPGYFHTVWLRADSPWVDFDLYVYDPNGYLVCSSTGPGGWESCTFYAWYRTYRVLVRSLLGASWYTLGLN